MKYLIDHIRKSKATYHLIYAMMACLALLGALSAFQSPKYKEGMAAAVDGFKTGLAMALSFLFGITVPGSSPPSNSVGAVMVTCPCGCKHTFDCSSQLQP